MPYCTVPARGDRRQAKANSQPVRLFYKTYGEGDCKIIMIMGVAATHVAWWPQIGPLTGTDVPNEADETDDEDAEDILVECAEVEAETEARALRPVDSSSSKSGMRITSDLGHKLMVHGTQALAGSKSSQTSTAGRESSRVLTSIGSEGGTETSSSGSATNSPLDSVFDRLDSEGFRPPLHGTKQERGGTDKLTGRMVCVFDNRGVGRSSHPLDSQQYRTDIMAADAIALADHLGWHRFHVIGHSMGGMIACKVAAAAPDRVLSLAVISSSNGNLDLLPRVTMRHMRVLNNMLSAKTPEARAAVDLDTHFSQEFLAEMVEGAPRRDHLHKEYVRTLSTKGAMQPKHAQNGQISACWNHGLSTHDVRHICKADIPTSIIHGSDDIIAHVSLGRRLARRLHKVARFVELYGGHMIVRERGEEVNRALIELLNAAQEGVLGEEWAESDPHRRESDALLDSCLMLWPRKKAASEAALGPPSLQALQSP